MNFHFAAYALFIATSIVSSSAFAEGKIQISVRDLVNLDISEGSYSDWRSQHGLPPGGVECWVNKKTGASECRIDQRDFELLNDRIRRLERAVRQLQDMVFDVAAANPGKPTPAPKPVFVCSLETAWKTFLGRGSTEVEARAKASQACEATNEAFCEGRKAKCEKEGG